jgi:hypothetical protein
MIATTVFDNAIVSSVCGKAEYIWGGVRVMVFITTLNNNNLRNLIFRIKINYECKTLFMQMSSLPFEFVLKIWITISSLLTLDKLFEHTNYTLD